MFSRSPERKQRGLDDHHLSDPHASGFEARVAEPAPFQVLSLLDLHKEYLARRTRNRILHMSGRLLLVSRSCSHFHSSDLSDSFCSSLTFSYISPPHLQRTIRLPRRWGVALFESTTMLRASEFPTIRILGLHRVAIILAARAMTPPRLSRCRMYLVLDTEQRYGSDRVRFRTRLKDLLRPAAQHPAGTSNHFATDESEA